MLEGASTPEPEARGDSAGGRLTPFSLLVSSLTTRAQAAVENHGDSPVPVEPHPPSTALCPTLYRMTVETVQGQGHSYIVTSLNQG